MLDSASLVMKTKNNARLLYLGLFMCTAISLPAQDIVTGLDFFDRVAGNYNQIQDYIAGFEMQLEGAQMLGTIYYKNPNLIRIDFTQPVEQVLVSDGKVLQVYVPSHNVTLTQRLESQVNPGGFASGEGLSLLRQNYQIAFKDSPSLQPLSARGSSEMVYKLLLSWRNTAQGFRQIVLDVSPQLFIRRMTAVTSDYRNVTFTFNNLRINQGIPNARFDYDSPPSSNNFDNFLYGDN